MLPRFKKERGGINIAKYSCIIVRFNKESLKLRGPDLKVGSPQTSEQARKPEPVVQGWSGCGTGGQAATAFFFFVAYPDLLDNLVPCSLSQRICVVCELWVPGYFNACPSATVRGPFPLPRGNSFATRQEGTGVSGS